MLLTAVLLQRHCCWAPVVQQSIDISCPPGAQQQTRRTLLQRSIAGTDRETDTVPLHRHAAYYASSVNHSLSMYAELLIRKKNITFN